ncbi:hypothetical protein M8C21_016920 [Ambrosia artemisiifolia]|uniref:Uncharacterized protein n=1 Tax=Ambrosia artemisiifolia TaxID=4212 RepID=A0AAD5D1I2_AMBAR|nr:hypothetical protein M8C21_016920 [Ambrosia artemisiifolia]
MDGDSCVEKSQGGEETVRNEKSATSNRPPSLADNRSKPGYVKLGFALLVIYNLLVQVLRWKYKGRTQTCFETQKVLINTSITSFLIAGLTLTLSLQYYMTSPTRKPLSPLLYRIIKTVFSVSAAVAHLSLVVFDEMSEPCIVSCNAMLLTGFANMEIWI